MYMYFKVGEIRSYLLGNTVYCGKILKVDEENETYLMEDKETKKQYVIEKDDVFIGDD